MNSEARNYLDVVGSRHPFEVFPLATVLVVGLMTAFGWIPEPESLRNFLDHQSYGLVVETVWSLAAVVGPAIALLGIAKPGPRSSLKMSVTALVMEQIGLSITGAVMLFYGPLIILQYGPHGFFAAGLVCAFGLSCWRQALKIHKILTEAARRGGGDSQ